MKTLLSFSLYEAVLHLIFFNASIPFLISVPSDHAWSTIKGTSQITLNNELNSMNGGAERSASLPPRLSESVCRASQSDPPVVSDTSHSLLLLLPPCAYIVCEHRHHNTQTMQAAEEASLCWQQSPIDGQRNNRVSASSLLSPFMFHLIHSASFFL